jgi:hypothetical protein
MLKPQPAQFIPMGLKRSWIWWSDASPPDTPDKFGAATSSMCIDDAHRPTSRARPCHLSPALSAIDSVGIDGIERGDRCRWSGFMARVLMTSPGGASTRLLVVQDW